MPDPIVAPIVTPNIGNGTLTAGTYYVQITYYSATSESLPSPETVASLVRTGSLQLPLPALQPASATGFRVYVGTTSGGETLQATHPFTSGSVGISTPLATGSAPPTANNSVCSLRFNDELIPTGTWYNTTIATSNGSTLPGFPQRWQLFGGSTYRKNKNQFRKDGEKTLCELNHFPEVHSSEVREGAREVAESETAKRSAGTKVWPRVGLLGSGAEPAYPAHALTGTVHKGIYSKVVAERIRPT